MSRLGGTCGVILALGIVALTIGGQPGCSREESAGAAPSEKPVRFALPLQAPSALAIIACEEGFFADEGLTVETTEYVSGKRALGAMLAGDADVAATADVPIVFTSFERSDFAILASIGTVDAEQRIVARRSRGVRQPADLRGKRVATQRASAVHFFLHLFLLKHGMSEEDVQLSFRRAEELPRALVAGEIDAFCMREPFVSRARELLQGDALVMAEPILYYHTDHVVATEAFLSRRPQAGCAIVRALLRAEEAARRDPKRAWESVARRLGVSPVRGAELRESVDLKVALDQGLYSSMEDVARWAIDSELVETEDMPNFLEFVHTDCLETVRPDAVTVIR